MTLLPVIERELRAQARMPLTYGLRVLGAAILLVTCVFFMMNGRGFAPNLGGELFSYLNFTLFCSIWILVPLLAADCISREKREGTLGLLFLTPLKAWDIVLAKGFVHGLRALTLWLAVLPILTLPFLIGGVSWKEAVQSVFMNFSSLCWALAAGLLASSITKVWARSAVAACLLATCFFVCFIFLTGLILLATFSMIIPSWGQHFFAMNGELLGQELFEAGFVGAADIEAKWGQYLAIVPPGSVSPYLAASGIVAGLSLFLLWVATRIAARRVQLGWQDRPPPLWKLQAEQKLCTPVIWVKFFRRWMLRKLERNPIGWLEQRTWTGRMVTWGWFAVMISLYSFAFRDGGGIGRSFEALQRLMGWLLIGSLAASAAGSFRRERETGVLELLLVSPIREQQIISGRLRGLWGQFLPALLVLFGIWIYFDGVFNQGYQSSLSALQLYATSFLTLPVIGLYYSLRKNNFVSAFLHTLLAGVLLPSGVRFMLSLVITSAFSGVFIPDSQRLLMNSQMNPNLNIADEFWFGVMRWMISSSFVSLLQFIIAFVLGRRLYRDLTRRNFTYSRAQN